MKYFISFCLIFVFVHVGAHEFSSSHVPDVSALYRIEEGLLPVLDTFISRREEYLRELEKVLQRTSALRKMSASEIGEYLANPLNQYFVVKRFVEDWGRLEDYMNSDSTSDGRFLNLRYPSTFFRCKDGNVRNLTENCSNTSGAPNDNLR